MTNITITNIEEKKLKEILEKNKHIEEIFKKTEKNENITQEELISLLRVFPIDSVVIEKYPDKYNL